MGDSACSRGSHRAARRGCLGDKQKVPSELRRVADVDAQGVGGALQDAKLTSDNGQTQPAIARIQKREAGERGRGIPYHLDIIVSLNSRRPHDSRGQRVSRAEARVNDVILSAQLLIKKKKKEANCIPRFSGEVGL